MTYPRTLNDVRDAVMNYNPNVESISADYAEALTRANVPMITEVFRVLSPVSADLDADGRAVLLGVAHLINAHNFSKMRSEALTVIQTVPEGDA